MPPAPVGEHIEPVRSTAMTMSTGVDEHGLQAFACVETLNWLMPKIRANQVFVLAAPLTVSWFGFTEAVQPVAMTAVVVHDVAYVKLNARFDGRVGGGVGGGRRDGRRGVRKVLGARERCGIRRALQLALGVVGVSDVDRERGNAKQRDERECHHRQNLATLSTCPAHPVSFRRPVDEPRANAALFAGSVRIRRASSPQRGFRLRDSACARWLRGGPECVVPERLTARAAGHGEPDERVLGLRQVGLVGRVGEHACDLGGRQAARIGGSSASSEGTGSRSACGTRFMTSTSTASKGW